MRAIVIGHDHVAGLGLLGPALERRDIRPEWTTVVPADRYDDPDVDLVLPDPAGADLVVTLGAPWPRERIEGWAAREVAFLRTAHDAGVPVLAICFGAQLLAEALGGGRTALPAARVGWHPVVPSDGRVPAGPWFCWNAEQLVAPPGAELLATSAAGHEAFAAGRSVGVQFHPEMTVPLLERWFTTGVPAGLDARALRAATAAQDPRRLAARAERVLALALRPPGSAPG
ncbi:gamma-glutamyl-gamma-aminobutyrate hydrolase family protein [Pseudonocardia sp. ICBG1293]|uniref:type 1 glutamine amidotransferase n=1 Tax=Pseudonocardia sp. ICBG1293 TaxID=2844382 RepID=UPI001CC9C58C|nr:gamma-glutamyl-gamma-aminobutyrate hydrolase family protein [Pseudonocardia sp. ICBG1293]